MINGRKSSNNIILIGMPGCGKTTVGKLLAESLNYEFMDTDQLIADITGKTPGQIVIDSGRDNFMEIQDQVVLKLDKFNCVISTGGGMVHSPAAMKHLKSIGQTVFLDTPFNLIEERMDKARKLARSGETLQELYNNRTPLYKKYADLILTCDSRSPEELCQNILLKINKKD